MNKIYTSGEDGVQILRPKVGSLGDGREKWRTNRGRRPVKRGKEEECNVWETEKSEKGGKRHASAGKKGARGMSPITRSPETSTSGTQCSLGSRLHQPLGHSKSAFNGEGRLWRPGPMLQNPASSPSRSRPPGGLSCRRFQPLLTWGPRGGARGGREGTREGGPRG